MWVLGSFWDGVSETEKGFWEICEENERDEKDDVRVEMDVVILKEGVVLLDEKMSL